MFKIGLLGYVGIHPETAELVQYFRHPGEVPLDRNDVLPDAEHFLIHPSLDLADRQLQPRLFPPSRQAQRDRRRAAVARGARRPSSCSRATCAGSAPSSRTRSPAPSFPAFFAEAVAEAGRDLAVAHASDGDAALLVDPNPRQVVMAALALRQRLLRSAYGCDIRFGGDAGFVEIAGEGPDARARTGLALLVAARLEPHAAAGHDPGHRPVRRRLARSPGRQRRCARGRSSRTRCRTCARATAASISPSRAARRRCCGGCACSMGRIQSAIPAISRTHDSLSYRVLYIQVRHGGQRRRECTTVSTSTVRRLMR